MSINKIYLEPELSLEQLAQTSGFSKHNLSQAINQCADKNFFDFINSLRIEHAKKLLTSTEKMNVQDILLISGFNSRSAFYNAFKKQTNMTPSQFKKESSISSS
jgi:AraC-like DNA-binding protein